MALSPELMAKLSDEELDTFIKLGKDPSTVFSRLPNEALTPVTNLLTKIARGDTPIGEQQVRSMLSIIRPTLENKFTPPAPESRTERTFSSRGPTEKAASYIPEVAAKTGYDFLMGMSDYVRRLTPAAVTMAARGLPFGGFMANKAGQAVAEKLTDPNAPAHEQPFSEEPIRAAGQAIKEQAVAGYEGGKTMINPEANPWERAAGGASMLGNWASLAALPGDLLMPPKRPPRNPSLVTGGPEANFLRSGLTDEVAGPTISSGPPRQGPAPPESPIKGTTGGAGVLTPDRINEILSTPEWWNDPALIAELDRTKEVTNNPANFAPDDAALAAEEATKKAKAKKKQAEAKQKGAVEPEKAPPELTPEQIAEKERVARLKEAHDRAAKKAAEKKAAEEAAKNSEEAKAKAKAAQKQAKAKVDKLDADFQKLYTEKGGEVPAESLALRNELAKRAGIPERSAASYSPAENKPFTPAKKRKRQAAKKGDEHIPTPEEAEAAIQNHLESLLGKKGKGKKGTPKHDPDSFNPAELEDTPASPAVGGPKPLDFKDWVEKEKGEGGWDAYGKMKEEAREPIRQAYDQYKESFTKANAKKTKAKGEAKGTKGKTEAPAENPLAQWEQAYRKARKQKKKEPPAPEGVDVSEAKNRIDAELGINPDRSAIASMGGNARVRNSFKRIPQKLKRWFQAGSIVINETLSTHVSPQVRQAINRKYPGLLSKDINKGLSIDEYAAKIGELNNSDVSVGHIAEMLKELAAAEPEVRGKGGLPQREWDPGNPLLPKKATVYGNELSVGDSILTVSDDAYTVTKKKGESIVFENTRTGEKYDISVHEPIDIADLHKGSLFETTTKGGIDPQTGSKRKGKRVAAEFEKPRTGKELPHETKAALAAGKKVNPQPGAYKATSGNIGPSPGPLSDAITNALKVIQRAQKAERRGRGFAGKIKTFADQLDDWTSQRFADSARLDPEAAEHFTRVEAAESHAVFSAEVIYQGLKEHVGRRAYKHRDRVVDLYYEEAARQLEAGGTPADKISYPRLSDKEYTALKKDKTIKKMVNYLNEEFTSHIEQLSLEAGVDPAKFIKVDSGLYFQLKPLKKSPPMKSGPLDEAMQAFDDIVDPYGYGPERVVKVHTSTGGTTQFTAQLGKKNITAMRKRTGGASVLEWDASLDNLILYAFRRRLKRIALNNMYDYFNTKGGLRLKKGMPIPKDFQSMELNRPIYAPKAKGKGGFTVQNKVYVHKDILTDHEITLQPAKTRNKGIGNMPRGIVAAASLQTGLALAVPAEAVAHSANFIGSYMLHPEVGRLLLGRKGGKLMYAPGVGPIKPFAALLESFSMGKKSPNYIRIRSYLAKHGALRIGGFENYHFAGELKLVRAMHKPMTPLRNAVFGLNGLETRARVTLARLLELDGKGLSEAQISYLVNRQMGTYVNRLAPPLVNYFKASLIDPFATAGVAMSASGIRALAGFHIAGGWNAATFYQGVVNTALSFIIWQKILDYKHRYPWEIPGSQLGDIVIEDPKRGKRALRIPLRLWAPGISRAFRMTGLRGIYNAQISGESMGSEAGREMANSLLSRIGPVWKTAMDLSLNIQPHITRSGKPLQIDEPPPPFETTGQLLKRKGKQIRHHVFPIGDPFFDEEFGNRPQSRSGKIILGALEMVGLAPQIIPDETRRAGAYYRTENRKLFENADYWGFKAIMAPTPGAGLKIILEQSKNIPTVNGTRGRWLTHALRNLVSASKSKHKSRALTIALRKMGYGHYLTPIPERTTNDNQQGSEGSAP